MRIGMKRKMSPRIRTLGNHERYAPITAAMAPDAPITGMVLLGSTKTWANVAKMPPTT